MSLYFCRFKEEDMSLSKIKEEIKTLNAASKKNKRPVHLFRPLYSLFISNLILLIFL